MYYYKFNQPQVCNQVILMESAFAFYTNKKSYSHAKLRFEAKV